MPLCSLMRNHSDWKCSVSVASSPNLLWSRSPPLCFQTKFTHHHYRKFYYHCHSSLKNPATAVIPHCMQPTILLTLSQLFTILPVQILPLFVCWWKKGLLSVKFLRLWIKQPWQRCEGTKDPGTFTIMMMLGVCRQSSTFSFSSNKSSHKIWRGTFRDMYTRNLHEKFPLCKSSAQWTHSRDSLALSLYNRNRSSLPYNCTEWQNNKKTHFG